MLAQPAAQPDRSSTMVSDKSNRPSDNHQTSHPSEVFRSVVSLVLFIHFFCVFVGMTCIAEPFSPFQARLRYVLWPYTQLLAFDLDSEPYYLTDYVDPGAEAQEFMDPHADFRIEILPADMSPDNDSHWISLNDTGLKGGERNRRYHRLATIMNAVSEDKTAVSLLAQGVANDYYARHNELPQKIRVRVHLPQPRSWINSPNKDRIDPDGPAYFRTVVSFNVTGLLDGQVGLTEDISAAEAATTDTPQQPETEGQENDSGSRSDSPKK